MCICIKFGLIFNIKITYTMNYEKDKKETHTHKIHACVVLSLFY